MKWFFFKNQYILINKEILFPGRSCDAESPSLLWCACLWRTNFVFWLPFQKNVTFFSTRHFSLPWVNLSVVTWKQTTASPERDFYMFYQMKNVGGTEWRSSEEPNAYCRRNRKLIVGGTERKSSEEPNANRRRNRTQIVGGIQHIIEYRFLVACCATL